LREGLGPEFADFEIEDLNPTRFAQKHLFGDFNGNNRAADAAAAAAQAARPARAHDTLLAPGERAPYDPDAT